MQCSPTVRFNQLNKTAVAGTGAISIIVPTLNEAGNLPLLFSRINKSLASSGITYEIIVIDDNSVDNTLAIAKKYAKKYHVSAITKKTNPGKAYSLIEGFKLAQYDIICMIDADLQYAPEEIARIYKKMHSLDVDIVLTERSNLKTPLLRKLSTKIFNIIFARLLFGINYDTQSGLKLFKKSVINSIDLSPSPWSFDLEFIIRSLEAGYKIADHKIIFSKRYKGQPKINILHASLELSLASIKLRRATPLKLLRQRYKLNNEYIKSALLVAMLILSCTSLVSFSAPKVSALSIPVPPNVIVTGLNNSLSSNNNSQTKTASSSPSGTTSIQNTAAPQNPSTTILTAKPALSAASNQSSTSGPLTLAAPRTPDYTEQHPRSSDPVYATSKLNSSSTKYLDKIAAILFIAALLMFAIGFALTREKKISNSKRNQRQIKNKKYSAYISKSR